MTRITFRAICRELGCPVSWLERVTWTHAAELGPCEKIGNARTWPIEVVAKLRAIRAASLEAKRAIV